jgi:hypothetical protein
MFLTSPETQELPCENTLFVSKYHPYLSKIQYAEVETEKYFPPLCLETEKGML